MLKKFGKFVRKQLLKSGRLERPVSDHEEPQDKARDKALFARILCAGQAVHNINPEKLDVCDVFPVRADRGMYEGMRDGKVVRRGYIDSTNWGGIQS